MGAGLAAVTRISARRADDTYLHAMLLGLSRLLGLNGARAKALLSQLLAPLAFEAESLLTRSQARIPKQRRRKRDPDG